MEQLLTDPDADVRSLAAGALGALGDTDVVPLLARMVESDSSPLARSGAAAALARLKWVPANERQAVRWAVAANKQKEAAALGTKAVGPLLEMFLDRKESLALRRHAGEALEAIADPKAASTVQVLASPGVADSLLGLLNDGQEDQDLRLRAGTVLTATRDTRAAKALLEILKGVRNGSTEIRVAHMLAALGDRRAVPLIAELWRGAVASGRSYDAKHFGKCMLAFQGAAEELDAAAEELELDPLRNKNERDRLAAVGMLQQLGGSRATQLLATALVDPARDVRRRAADALAQLGWRPADARERIRYAAVREDWKAVEAEGPAAAPALLDMWRAFNRSSKSEPDAWHYNQFDWGNRGFLRVVAAGGEERASNLFLNALRKLCHDADAFPPRADSDLVIVMDGLARLGPAVAERLASMLTGMGEGWASRLDKAVVELLGRIAAPEAVGPLLKHLDPPTRAMDHAAKALEKILERAAARVSPPLLRAVAKLSDHKAPPDAGGGSSCGYSFDRVGVSLDASRLRQLARQELIRRGERA